jgi:alkylation response protein AidB-like acyl-CoA dehydrogenase
MQHRCANVLVDVEGSQNVTSRAAWQLNTGLPAARLTALAQARVCRAFCRVVTPAHQIHGAIDFTEDHILQHHTKRAGAPEFSFGDNDFHLEHLSCLSVGK